MDFQLLKWRLAQAAANRAKRLIRPETAVKLSWPLARFRNDRQLAKRHAPERTVVVDFGAERTLDEIFPEVGDWRYLYRLCQVFLESGYRVRVRLPVCEAMYARSRMYRHLFRVPGLALGTGATSDLDQCAFLLTSVNSGSETALPSARALRVNFNVAATHASEGRPLIVPFGPHPFLGQAFQPAALERLRRPEFRTLRLLFAGSHDEQYAQPVVGCHETRYGLLQRIETEVPSESVRAVTESRGYNAAFSRGAKYDSRLTLLKQRRPQREWLRCLARADVFLCLPGLVMPMCHNTVEAMAVGTIPMIGYPQWFSPALEHMRNCIVFETADELLDRIAEVRSMSAQTLRQLRAGVLDYYQAHLTSRSVLEKLQRDESIDSLYVIAEAPHNLAILNPESVLYQA